LGFGVGGLGYAGQGGKRGLLVGGAVMRGRDKLINCLRSPAHSVFAFLLYTFFCVCCGGGNGNQSGTGHACHWHCRLACLACPPRPAAYWLRGCLAAARCPLPTANCPLLAAPCRCALLPACCPLPSGLRTPRPPPRMPPKGARLCQLRVPPPPRRPGILNPKPQTLHPDPPPPRACAIFASRPSLDTLMFASGTAGSAEEAGTMSPTDFPLREGQRHAGAVFCRLGGFRGGFGGWGFGGWEFGGLGAFFAVAWALLGRCNAAVHLALQSAGFTRPPAAPPTVKNSSP
jgi:hypothetical protein